MGFFGNFKRKISRRTGVPLSGGRSRGGFLSRGWFMNQARDATGAWSKGDRQQSNAPPPTEGGPSGCASVVIALGALAVCCPLGVFSCSAFVGSRIETATTTGPSPPTSPAVAVRPTTPATPAAPPAPTVADFFGHNLSREDSAAFLLLNNSDKNFTTKTHNRRPIGVTGTVHVAKWHTDRNEGLFVILTIRPRAGAAKELGCVANFPVASEKAVLALRPGDTATIRGQIDGIITGPDSLMLGLDTPTVVAHVKSAESIAADKALETERQVAEEKRAAEEKRKRESSKPAEPAAPSALEEKDALTLLDFAQRETNTNVRIKSLRAIIEKFPKTKAAAEAKKLLGP